MCKQDIKSMLRYFDSASDSELEIKLIKLITTQPVLKTEAAIADANWLIKEIKLELEARNSLSA
ncbi:hypothetical protein [Methylomonas sp. AM2-LC]|uniref:hypothetical protein n=1 Tax=Methylomonas sp. AM2-LC TaxID=3153301 RepID=UPI0032630EEA